jgi:alkanesulfonate monooxygenase SsuD/methylene tetrahydromethanopterin reductase-like flavin-dependent oxidoreductase (luciferase family)
MRIGVKPGPHGWDFNQLQQSWTAAERAGFDVISCFDHVTAFSVGLPAWDAPSLLTAMAGVTERAALAVDVVNISLRHPYLLAAQLAVAQAASSGRLEVGLGAGSHRLARFDHSALAVRFPPLTERCDRLARCCEAFPALWRGEEVTDPQLGLNRASLGPLGVELPPIVVGGTSEATMTISAAHADGWNASVTSADQYAQLSRRADELCRQVGRSRALRKAVQVFVRDIDLAHAKRLMGELEHSGADTVTFVLTAEHGPHDVHSLARAVLS